MEASRNFRIPVTVNNADPNTISRSIDMQFDSREINLKVIEQVAPDDKTNGSQPIVRTIAAKVFPMNSLSHVNRRFANTLLHGSVPQGIATECIEDIFREIGSRTRDENLRNILPTVPNKESGYDVTAHGVFQDIDGRFMLVSFKSGDSVEWALPFGKVFRGNSPVNSLKRSIETYFGVDLPEDMDGVCLIITRPQNHRPVINIGYACEVDFALEHCDVGWFSKDNLPENMTEIASAILQSHLDGSSLPIEEIE